MYRQVSQSKPSVKRNTASQGLCSIDGMLILISNGCLKFLENKSNLISLSSITHDLMKHLIKYSLKQFYMMKTGKCMLQLCTAFSTLRTDLKALLSVVHNVSVPSLKSAYQLKTENFLDDFVGFSRYSNRGKGFDTALCLQSLVYFLWLRRTD